MAAGSWIMCQRATVRPEIIGWRNATAGMIFRRLSRARRRISGIDGDTAYQNMPGYHLILSRAEMDTLIAYIRTLEMVPADH